MTSNLIIDTDCGVDDAEAIILALKQKDCNILGISCIDGNTSLENVTSNVARVMHCYNKKVPIYKSPCSLSKASFDTQRVSAHGPDGFAGLANEITFDPALIQDQNAVDWLVETVNSKPKEITIVTLGPLTNLAEAQKKEAAFSRNVKELVIMGGRSDTNGKPHWNFSCDPCSANFVLSQFKCPIKLVTLDSCVESYLDWEWFDKVINQSDCLVKKLRTAQKKFVDMKVLHPGFISCDFFAMASALFPNSVVSSQMAALVTVNKYGQTMLNYDCLKKCHITVVQKMNADILRNIFESILL